MKEAEGLARVTASEAVSSIIIGPEAAAAAWVSSAVFSGSVEEIDDGSKSKTWAGSTVGIVCTTADVIESVAIRDFLSHCDNNLIYFYFPAVRL